MNRKTLIPKLAMVAFALSTSAALSQEEILIITGKRMDKTVSYQISPNARELDLSGNQLTSLTLPAGLRLRVLDIRNNPIEQLLVPEGRNIDNLELHGFSKEDIERYTSSGWDGCVVILFSGGVLEYTENLSSGEWKDLPDAFPPFRINPTVAAQRFFRVLPFEPFYQKNVSVNLANQVISWNSIPGFEYRIESKVRPEDHWREIGKVVADSRTTVWNFTQVAPGNYQIFRIARNSPIELSIEKEY